MTDNQFPSCLDRLKQRFPEAKTKLVLVDHKTIDAGHEDLLPTFCSGAIETMLFNIPGLDDEFVDFNNDFLLLREVSSEDFFVERRIQLHSAWQSSLRQALKLKFRGLCIGRGSQNGISRNEQMWRSAVMAGETKRYRLCAIHAGHLWDLDSEVTSAQEKKARSSAKESKAIAAKQGDRGLVITNDRYALIGKRSLVDHDLSATKGGFRQVRCRP